MTRAELKNTFPWLGQDDDEEVNGGDVVDSLVDLYESLPAEEDQTPERLFIGVWSTGIEYCDRQVPPQDDYKPLAFLNYRTLDLSLRCNPDHALVPEIRKHAEGIIARRGEQFEFSGCGQTVTLGDKLKG